ncbi:MAG: 4-hydroxythreonine-4-phosphate dehydrogenase PdxA [Desulfobacterales bacterium]|nr:4-hydroxythreonine-4-phosphate dehydrogenase PdxA [Desulfobacterales bacterium]
MKPKRPCIGITMGDPSGIGPELVVKTLASPDTFKTCRPLVIGDVAVMEAALALLDLQMEIHPVRGPEYGKYRPGVLDILPLSQLSPPFAGPDFPTPETGTAMQDYILKGIELAMTNEIQALVTGPITKTGLARAGSAFHGHTELLAHETGTENFGMMMAGDRLKVVLATIHIPLSKVPEELTRERLMRIIRLTHDSLKDRFGMAQPRLAAAGLNPHAGEETLFGTEERDTITPTLEAARKEGIDIDGPLPPDTVFFHANNGRYDAVVCMYHDQGLIPFKLLHFEDGVNTTLGLPIIRTSVDHGTAYDIAWQGIAKEDSMIQALKMAVLQANNRTDYP